MIETTPGAKAIRLWLPRGSPTNTDESTESEPHSSERRQDANLNPIGDICYASPDETDVKMMRQWKIPTRDAPKILSEWRSAHSQNKHEICVLYKVLIEDLTQRQIPYKQAKGMLELEKNALISSSEANNGCCICFHRTIPCYFGSVILSL